MTIAETVHKVRRELKQK